MNNSDREEIWLARIVFIFGAKELIDFGLNICTLVKRHAELGLVSSTSPAADAVTLAYLLSSGGLSIYLLAGGSVFSRIAYGHRTPRDKLLADVPFPSGSGWLSLAFRAFAVYRCVEASYEVLLGVTHHDYIGAQLANHAPRLSVVWTVDAVERFAIGFLLLKYGGRLAAYFVGKSAASQPQ